MSTVTSVDPRWLAELGGVFYSVKEKGYSTQNRRVIETEFNRKMEIEAKMAEDKKRHEEKLAIEENGGPERVGGGAGAGAKKKVAKAGAVKKPVVKRRGGGMRF